MNQVEQLFADLASAYRSEMTAQRRYRRTGSFTVSKEKAEGEIKDAALARILDSFAEAQGKEAVHIMPEEVTDLRAAGFKVSKDPITGAVDVDDPVAQHGRNGDTELAFVTDEMVQFLLGQGGSGTINPKTGLREFYDSENDTADAEAGAGRGGGDAEGSDVGDDAGPGESPGGGSDTDAEGEHDHASHSAVAAQQADVSNPEDNPEDTGMGPEGTRGIANLSHLSKGYQEKHRTYAVPKSKTKKEQIDAYARARHSHNPTRAQRGMNRETEVGFAEENPGVVGAMNAAMGVMGMAVPGVSAVSTVGNAINAATGRPSMGFASLAEQVGVDIPGLSGIASDLGIDVGDLGIDLGEISTDVMGSITDMFGEGDPNAAIGNDDPGGSYEGDDQPNDTSITDNQNTEQDTTDQDESDASALLEILLTMMNNDPGSTGTPLDWRF
jgi:hypothetical protein